MLLKSSFVNLIISRNLKVTQSVFLNYFFFLLSEQTYFDVRFDYGEKFVFNKQSVSPVTVITFKCNESATWEASEDHNVPQLAHVRVNYTTKFEFLTVGKINNLRSLR